MSIKKQMLKIVFVFLAVGMLIVPVLSAPQSGPNTIKFSSNLTKSYLVHQQSTNPFNVTYGSSSVSMSSNVGNGQLSTSSWDPSISADGSTIAYVTEADIPKPGQAGNIYVYNRITGKTTRASVDSKGIPLQNSFAYTTLSGDGHYVAFTSYGADDQYNGLLVHDTQTGETTRITEAGAEPKFSSNGQFLVFTSGAVLSPRDTNGVGDIYVYDMNTQKFTQISTGSDGSQANGRSFWPCISGNGNEVVFVSEATNLAPVNPNTWNVFLHDMKTGKTTIISNIDGDPMRTAGDPPAISEDGGSIAFHSQVSRMFETGYGQTTDMNIYVLDLITGKKTRIAYGTNEFTDSASISEDGQYLAFHKDFDVKKPGGMVAIGQVFVMDMNTGKVECASVSSGGVQGSGSSNSPEISSDGRFVVFSSGSSDLVTGDSNGLSDIFLRDRVTKTTIKVSMPPSKLTSVTLAPTFPVTPSLPSSPLMPANKTPNFSQYSGSITIKPVIRNPVKPAAFSIFKVISPHLPLKSS